MTAGDEDVYGLELFDEVEGASLVVSELGGLDFELLDFLDLDLVLDVVLLVDGVVVVVFLGGLSGDGEDEDGGVGEGGDELGEVVVVDELGDAGERALVGLVELEGRALVVADVDGDVLEEELEEVVLVDHDDVLLRDQQLGHPVLHLVARDLLEGLAVHVEQQVALDEVQLEG